ncbi:hypothetical protein C8J57DRAFT_1252983 [Mycena rebaudengoi]|nr:hypothetical protein C8J57DRAFT_1252983 [Mycena rebaudengoi]
MSSAVSSRRSPSVEELPEDDVPRHNLLPDDCSFLLMDDADFRVTFNVPASAPPGFHAAAAVIPTPSTPTFDQPLSEAPSSGPSSAALGKRRLIDIRVDPLPLFTYVDAPVRSTYNEESTDVQCPMFVKVCVLANVAAVEATLQISLAVLVPDVVAYVIIIGFPEIVDRESFVPQCDVSNVQKPSELDVNLITTSTLNVWYGLVAVCSDVPPRSVNGEDNEIAVSCTDIRKFCELFHYLDLSVCVVLYPIDYGSPESLHAHRVKELPRKPVMVQEPMRHSISNEILVDVDDGTQFCSTYLLNKDFELSETVTDSTLTRIHLADMDVKYIAVHSSSLAGLVSLFSHFSVEHLTGFVNLHCITVPKSKPLLEEYISEHQCNAKCPGNSQVLLFEQLRKQRQGIFQPRTVQIIRDRERARKLRFNTNAAKRKEKGAPAQQSVKQAAWVALTEAELCFPYMATSDRYRTAVEWQDYTHPPRWLPTPCAVCAHDTTAHLLTAEYPLDYDLTLLQNPALPAETLPTTYNLEAYDGAILCPEGLTDGTRKSIIRMCAPCRKTFGEFRQPLDAMANFQYYVHDELPAPVKAAFDGASMYDIMMVARSRATRITHLFKKAGKTSNAGSQGYSQGNVAIFA